MKIVKNLAIVAALILGFTSLAKPSHAETAERADCLQTAMTNFEYQECTSKMIDAADKRLNTAWKRLFEFEGGSKDEGGRALLSEQRAWIAFREKACAEYFRFGHGREGQVLHGPLCIVAIIDARTDDLKNRYELSHP